MNKTPVAIAELSLDDWVAVGSGWTYLPYLARYSVPNLPKDWRKFLEGRFSAVLESGQTGNTTIAVPRAPSVKVFNLNGTVIKHTQLGAYESHQEKFSRILRLGKINIVRPILKAGPIFKAD
ncbi:MAG: hypothetical protein EBQ49_07295 [Verrucomicrobia bacterium]|nr:hypothetical protein [Verrucomicrobiota bacterium]